MLGGGDRETAELAEQCPGRGVLRCEEGTEAVDLVDLVDRDPTIGVDPDGARTCADFRKTSPLEVPQSFLWGVDSLGYAVNCKLRVGFSASRFITKRPIENTVSPSVLHRHQ